MRDLYLTGAAALVCLVLASGCGSKSDSSSKPENAPPVVPVAAKLTECKFETPSDLVTAIKQEYLYAEGLAATLREVSAATKFIERDEASNIAYFQKLEEIDLSHAEALCPLKGLPKLRKLGLRFMERINLAELATFPRLEHLKVDVNDIKDLSFVIHVPQLRSLIVWGHGADSGPISSLEPLKALSQLVNLHIEPSLVRDLSPLAHLKTLEVIAMPKSLVKDLTPLAQLPNLRGLDLRGSVGLQSLAGLDGAAKLTHLELSETNIRSVAPLANLRELSSLFLSKTQVRDISPLADLKKLRRFILGCNNPMHFSWRECRGSTPVEDISVIANFAELEALDLSGTRVQNIAPLGALKKLLVLELNATSVEDISALAGATALEELQIGQTRVRSLASLAALLNIKKLNMAFSSVDTVAALSGFSVLEQLNIQGTQVSNLEPLVGLKKLNRVRVAHSAVTDAELGSFNVRQKTLGLIESAAN